MRTAAWHRLRDGTGWHEPGAARFDRTGASQTANRLIRRLWRIGCVVRAQPAGREAFRFRPGDRHMR
ncbi:MAG: hypothetical protein J0L57_13070 [Burkholderiales bacterium]|nr:hypothetical protein [Burkholderiales bacterium]